MAIFLGNTEINSPSILDGISEIRLGSQLVWQAGLPEGTTFDFEYTGTVQSVELPRGKYKLQCWGAQGGTSYGSSNGVGSKGGYSEGVLTLTKTTTLYIFVGGKGSRGSSTSLVNGGWNGGGASVGYSYYGSSSGEGTYGYSYPACGGGATDISTVTSSMSYSSGRTNRSAASLLARCIVAGGGAGGSYGYTKVTTIENVSQQVTKSETKYPNATYEYSSEIDCRFYFEGNFTSASGYTVYGVPAGYGYTSSKDSGGLWVVITIPSGAAKPNYSNVRIVFTYTTTESVPQEKVTTSSLASTNTRQGGGETGKGTYPGAKTTGGNGAVDGGFGYGASQTATNYRYCAGGAGGGWYGGGLDYSDSNQGSVRDNGGGSGFVNTSANASYRPSGYTGLQLDSGETIAGNTSHPSTSGGTETGHSGNGYAKITVIE